MTQVATKVSKIYRLAGAILAETAGEYYLVGELKEPYDFEEHGFEKPSESDLDQSLKFKKLKALRPVAIEGEHLEMEIQGEALAELLFKRFVILRNHSVSDRLWRLATVNAKNGVIDARWVEQTPDDVWQLLRDSVLKCL